MWHSDRSDDEFARLRRTDAAVIESLRRAGDSYRDPRIKAVLAIAPALGSSLTKVSLTGRIPVERVVGDPDVTTPMATNAAHIAALVPGARSTVLPGVTHDAFLDPYGERGVQLLDLYRRRSAGRAPAVRRNGGRLLPPRSRLKPVLRRAAAIGYSAFAITEESPP